MADNEKNKDTAPSSEPAEQKKDKVSKPIKDLLGDVVKAQKEGSLGSEEEASDKETEPETKAKKEKKKTNVKQLKHGMMSTVLTIVFIAAVVLVNVIATVLFERYPLTIDLTKEKKYSISTDSQEYIEKIDVDVLVTIFSTEEQFKALSDYTVQALEMLKKYQKYNDRISYRFVEIDSNPDIVADYGAEAVSQFGIIFETNPTDKVKRTRKVNLTDLVKFNDELLTNLNQYGMTIENLVSSYGDLRVMQAYASYIEASRADEAFMSALMAVTDPTPTTAVFLTGRQEVDNLAYLHSLLEANGYYVKDVDITKEEIPEETNLIILAAPTIDYLPEEIDKIDKYLENGGALGKQMLYCASVRQGETPNLDEFLAEYGIEIGGGVVCEQSGDYYYQLPYYTITNDISSNFTQDVGTSSPVLLNAISRPIKLLFDERGFNGTEAYVKSTNNAYIYDLETREQLSKGQQIYTAVASKAIFSTEDGSGTYSNIVVYGAVESLADAYLSYPQFNNREYVLSLLNGVTNKTRTGIVIEPKVIEGNVFDLTDKQRSVLQWTFILIIPAVVLIVGGVIWLRRKNR
ncbi:MAG: GldG family protein [Ruminococcus sp.]|nr:GldG family protein [Ruminococcus sp.]